MMKYRNLNIDKLIYKLKYYMYEPKILKLTNLYK